MNLLAIRKQFVKLSGRYDLVVDAVDYADNGADFYINDGMNMLDKLVDLPESKAKLYFDLSSGEYSVTFQNSCRVIEEVWVNDSESRYQLIKVSLNELKSFYPEPASVTSTGKPSAFAIAELRALKTTTRDSLGTFINKTWDEDSTNYDYRGIVIVPPADGSYV
ncbi:hypothetical protein KA005_24455, partial [bacterium]|nr:hypothetical protein [bacterium]